MDNHFPDCERVKRAESVNSLDIQVGNGDGVTKFDTLSPVNDSATSASSDTPATQPCSSPVLSQGEAA